MDPPANAEVKDGSVGEVFTTAAGALYETGSLLAPRAPMGFPVAATAQYEALTAASTLTSVVLHPEPISRVKYGRWAEVNQRLSAAVDDLDTRELKQRLVDRALLKDLQPDLAAAANKAGVSLGLHTEVDTSRGWDALSDCPSLAMYRQIYTLKHLDRGSRWEDNDLIDLTYLAPAVTYAHAVACEAKAASLFARALPVSDRKAAVVTKLPALVEVLESLIS